MLTQYAYLFWSSIMLVISVLLILGSPNKGKSMFLAGLYSSPYSLASVLFVPRYWNPSRVGNPLVGIEDLAFSFATGTVVWWLASQTLPRHALLQISLRRSFFRYASCSTIGLGLALIAWAAGLEIMSAFGLSMVLISTFFLVKHPWYWRLSISGALGFASLYGILILMAFHLRPEFAAQWSTHTLMGERIHGVPIEEFFWAFGYGAVFPMILAFSYRVRLELAPPSS